MRKDKYQNTRVVIRQENDRVDYYLFENSKGNWEKAMRWWKKGEGGLITTLEEILKAGSQWFKKHGSKK